jgi:catechol 2,3-dioxygenase-like lactoylglutathione lyase family enzyme
MPNLENLRKQAKQYVRWHRERYFPVAAAISHWLPRFAGLGDRAVLDAEFKLADAQELVARKQGFESWAALKEGAAITDARAMEPGSRPLLLAAEPQLFTSDMEAAIGFYVQKLGFEVAFSYGNPPFYAQVSRDGVRLNLRRVRGRVFDESLRDREADALSATIAVDDAKALFLEYQDAGVRLHQALRKEPWGASTFIVADLDGNLVCFAG